MIALRSLSLLAAVPLVLVAATARADERPTKPGLVLARGQLELAINLELEMSADKIGKPVSIAPDVAYGVSDDLTVALVHSLYGVTGFRARAGGGLCVTGTDHGCVAVYNNVGAEGWYQPGRRALAFALGGGVHATNLDAGYYAAKVGARLRYPAGKLTLQAAPSVLIAITKREDAAGNALNKDTLWIPIQATYRIRPPITVGLGSGIKGPLSGFGEAWQVPLGAMVQYAVAPSTSVGASWVFGAIFGGADDPPAPAPALTGPELRGVQVWCRYTR